MEDQTLNPNARSQVARMIAVGATPAEAAEAVVAGKSPGEVAYWVWHSENRSAKGMTKEQLFLAGYERGLLDPRREEPE